MEKKSELTSKIGYVRHRLIRLYYVMKEEKPDLVEAKDLIDDINYCVDGWNFLTEKWQKQEEQRKERRRIEEEKEQAKYYVPISSKAIP